MEVIARIENEFVQKFGIPRQSGLTEMKSLVVFEPKYRRPEALRGIESYSHLWLIWEFSACGETKWRPTVRPPRLGGNQRMGVFATRSPFRPNRMGLSSVKLERVLSTEDRGLVLEVSGADLMNGTPILDIKPYITYTDAHPEAVCGFADEHYDDKLEVVWDKKLQEGLTPEMVKTIWAVLEHDPRPHYHDDPQRVYGMELGDLEVRFKVAGEQLFVMEIKKRK